MSLRRVSGSSGGLDRGTGTTLFCFCFCNSCFLQRRGFPHLTICSSESREWSLWIESWEGLRGKLILKSPFLGRVLIGTWGELSIKVPFLSLVYGSWEGLEGKGYWKVPFGVLGRGLESFVSHNKPRFNLLFVYLRKLFHGLALFFGFCMRGTWGTCCYEREVSSYGISQVLELSWNIGLFL